MRQGEDAQMATTRQELIWLTEDAINEAAPHHESIAFEQRVYANNKAYTGDETVGRVYTPAGEVLYPKGTALINKMGPRIEESFGRVKFIPDRSSRLKRDIELIDDMQAYYDMTEDADNEADNMHVAVFHNMVGGMAVRKTRVDTVHQRVSCPVISPLTFAPDPQCVNINLSDADYVVQTNMQTTRHVRRHYPQFTPRTKNGQFRRTEERGEVHKIHEIWLRRHLAEEIGIDVKGTQKQIIRAVLIDDDFVFARPSPWIYPDFPYSCWRNFLNYSDDGKPNNFWGFGYAKLLWPQQKMLDHLLANLVLIINNQATGRMLAPRGALDMNQLQPIHGLVIEYDGETYDLSQIQHLPPEVIPPILLQFVELIASITEDVSGINAVFSGEAPFAGVSGRAVAALQAAAFTQPGSIIRGGNRFRARSARQKMTFLQQTARRPVAPNLWRGGIDLPDEFPEEARHIGFGVQIPDSSQLPQTPAGKLQIVEFLRSVGFPLSTQQLLEFVGLDTGYGLQPTDFAVDPSQALIQQLNEEVLSGQEVSPRDA